jgi:dynein intermediate chain 1
MAEDEVFFHFQQMSRVMHKNSDEMAAQADYDKNFKEMVADKRRARQMEAQEQGKTLTQAELEEDDTQRNQFNFTERAAQTYNPTTKTRTISTTPPETTNGSGIMTQWALYDAYVIEFERLQAIAAMQNLAKTKKPVGASGEPEPAKASGKTNPLHSPEMANRIKIMERLVNQVRCLLFCFAGRPRPSPPPHPAHTPFLFIVLCL